MSNTRDFFKGLLDPGDLELLQMEHDDDDHDNSSVAKGRESHVMDHSSRWISNSRQGNFQAMFDSSEQFGVHVDREIHRVEGQFPGHRRHRVADPNAHYSHYYYGNQQHQQQFQIPESGYSAQDVHRSTFYDDSDIHPNAHYQQNPNWQHGDSRNWKTHNHVGFRDSPHAYHPHQQQHWPKKQRTGNDGTYVAASFQPQVEYDGTIDESYTTPVRHHSNVHVRNSNRDTAVNVIPDYYDDGCESVSVVDPRFRNVFRFTHFNKVQSLCLNVVYRTDKNIAVSAPTGSGKTAILELAIVRLLEKSFSSSDANLQQRKRGAFKSVYIGPIKALCQEKTKDWTERFGALGITCRELTGDTDHMSYHQLLSADIILTTPEKWDSFTRSWRSGGVIQEIIGNIALILIDEVHILNENRGATLEAVVSRMKTIKINRNMSTHPVSQLRFVALSATIPNIEDVAHWLSVPPEGIITCGDEYRPVKLDTHVVGFRVGKNDFMFDKFLDFKLSSIIAAHRNDRPALVFCPTRKSAQTAAQQLVKDAEIGHNPYIRDNYQRQHLQSASSSATDRTLRDCIAKGIGYHHAGLSYQDRLLVEKLFLDGMITVVCTTSTLAQGVNLPAHLVVIKGTKQYKNGTYVDYGELNILQMIGRAGRPQFDTTGTAVIMTGDSDVYRYETLVNRKQLVESQLHKNVIEHLNAEIMSETIGDVVAAVEWIKSTFLFIRMRKNPSHYNMPSNLDSKVKEMLLSQLRELARFGMVEYLDEDHFTLRGTAIGRSMAKYYTSFETMKLFCALGKDSTMEDILMALSGAEELQECILRRGEKTILNNLNKDKERIRWPLKGGRSAVKTIAHKVFLLIQDELSDSTASLEDFNLKQNVNHIFQVIHRLCRCLCECLRERKFFNTLSKAMLLGKCLEQRMWEDTRIQCRQLTGIGKVLSTNLEKAGAGSLEALLSLEPRRIESICGKRPPFGIKTHESILTTPWYDVSAEVAGEGVLRDQRGQEYVDIRLEARRRVFFNKNGQPRAAPKFRRSLCTVLVGNRAGDLLDVKKFQAASTEHYTTVVRIFNNVPSRANSELVIRLVEEHFIGVDSVCKLVIDGFSTNGLNKHGKLQSAPVPAPRHPTTTFDDMVAQSLEHDNKASTSARRQVKHSPKQVKTEKGHSTNHGTEANSYTKPSNRAPESSNQQPKPESFEPENYSLVRPVEPSKMEQFKALVNTATDAPYPSASTNATNGRNTALPRHYPSQWQMPVQVHARGTVENNLDSMISQYLNNMRQSGSLNSSRNGDVRSSAMARNMNTGYSPRSTTSKPHIQASSPYETQDGTLNHREPVIDLTVDITGQYGKEETNDVIVQHNLQQQRQHPSQNSKGKLPIPVTTRSSTPLQQQQQHQEQDQIQTAQYQFELDADLANARTLDDLLQDLA